MAVQDYMRPPAATAPDASGYRGRAGDAIRVQATDDFGVAGVQGRILAPGGALLEEGPACAGEVDDVASGIRTTLDGAPYGCCCTGAAVAYLSHRLVRNARPANTPARPERM